MNEPNLFSFATSELSQDAFLCWMMAWANPDHKTANASLQACGEAFINTFLAKKGIVLDHLSKVEIRRQEKHIDVLCLVNDAYVILIEDKTGTSSHGDQLQRYVNQVLGKGFAAESIVPIYYKTTDQSHFEHETRHGYFPFTRQDALKILTEYDDGTHAILHDYTLRMQEIEAWTQSYASLPLGRWGWHSWIGFYQELQRRLQDGNWKYVSNPSGGFLGMWCFWTGDLYLQLEQERLCFKVHSASKEVARQVRHSLLHSAESKAAQGLVAVRKPERMSAGIYTTFAVSQESYRKEDQEGKIDMDATVAFIKDAGKLVQALSKEYHGK